MKADNESTPPGVAAVIVNYEGGDHLLECVASIEGQGVVETIVVDNGSTDGSAAAALARFRRTTLVTPGRNLGFAGGANRGADEATAELVLFLNPDIRLPPGVVNDLASHFREPGVGVVGPPLRVAATGSVEYGATVDVIGSPVPLERHGAPLYVPGCALMTRTMLFRELGGFDARFFMFVEDVDYCWRVLLRGYEVRVPDVEPVWHEGGAAAAGGYINAGRLESTTFRVSLRERNTLATLLKCYGVPLAITIGPIYVLQTLATAAALALRGHRRTARSVVLGVAWNVRQMPSTLRFRRGVQRTRTLGDGPILRRMYRGVWKLHLLRRFGVPRVVESASVKRPQQSSRGHVWTHEDS